MWPRPPGSHRREITPDLFFFSSRFIARRVRPPLSLVDSRMSYFDFTSQIIISYFRCWAYMVKEKLRFVPQSGHYQSRRRLLELRDWGGKTDPESGVLIQVFMRVWPFYAFVFVRAVVETPSVFLRSCRGSSCCCEVCRMHAYGAMRVRPITTCTTYFFFFYEPMRLWNR